MVWQYSLHAGLYTVIAVTMVAFGTWAYRYRATVGARPLSGLFFAVAVWTATFAGAMAQTDPTMQRLFHNAAYLGIAVIPVLFLYFAEAFSNTQTPLTRYGPVPLFVVPALTQVLIWTNDWHHLMWNGVEVVENGAELSVDYGLWFWFHSAYSYVLLFAAMALFVRMWLVSEDVYRGQVLTVLFAASVPWLANAAYLSGVTPFDATPPAFAITAVMFMLAIFRHRLLEMVPVAREVARDELMDNLVEAVFVLDDDHRIIDCNQRAARIAGEDDQTLLGRSISDALPDLASTLSGAATDGGAEGTELALRRDGKLRYYDVEVAELHRAGGLLTGHLVSLRDVTNRRQREQRLNVLNRALRHDLRNEANVVLGYAELGKQDNPDAEWVDAIETHISGLIDLSEKVRQLEQALDSEDVGTRRMDAAEVVETVVDDIESDRPDVTVETDLPASAPVSAIEFFADAVRNALENAVEHNDNPEPLIEVAVSVWVEGDEVVIEVADNGPGIHEEERAVLLRGRETQLEHVSGLGLWIINWIVTESGGTVQFEENEPRGSIVTVRLPAADGVPEEQEAREPVDPAADTDSRTEDALS